MGTADEHPTQGSFDRVVWGFGHVRPPAGHDGWADPGAVLRGPERNACYASNGDVMQCAESLGYPAGTPVPLEESINQGVAVLAHKLNRAGSTGPTDIPAISLALQAYNYGDGYFSWAAPHGGGYNKENAWSFRQYQMSHGFPGHGWNTYAGHEGIDIPMSVGEPVYACAAGTATYARADWHSGMGYDPCKKCTP